jgi:hypothetical protein
MGLGIGKLEDQEECLVLVLNVKVCLCDLIYERIVESTSRQHTSGSAHINQNQM